MEYIYYRAVKGNFGDDLNGWLWPRFFGEANAADKTAFVGIGSILYNEFPLFEPVKDKKKIVFGTGIRPAYAPLKLDNSWDIKFLRGPLSALTLQNKYEYIADAAYALRLADGFEPLLKTPKKYKVSLIPYFKSYNYVDWASICKTLGYNLISPWNEKGMDHTLQEIAASEYIITEAMHGAILADLFRIPWKRFVLSTPFTEGQMVSEFKWNDWLFSINKGNLDTIFIKFHRKSFVNRFISKATFDAVNIEFLLKNLVTRDIIQQLSSLNDFDLSSDKVIGEIDERILGKIDEVKKQINIL